MATYTEIAVLYSESALKNQVSVAIASAAQAIVSEADTVPNHAERYDWAARAMSNPGAEAQRFLIGILVANKSASVAQIESATDAAVQSNVDDLVDIFALADAAQAV